MEKIRERKKKLNIKHKKNEIQKWEIKFKKRTKREKIRKQKKNKEKLNI